MGEVRFEQDLVRALLRDQHPDLADLELRDVDGGWDNQQWRSATTGPHRRATRQRFWWPIQTEVGTAM